MQKYKNMDRVMSNSASLCSMKSDSLEIRDGIVFFEGNIAGNLLFSPMVSNAYFIEDGEEAILFDPSCGKKIARRIENYIQKRHAAGAVRNLEVNSYQKRNR